MTTFGYARVSTTGQSLESQLEALSFCDKIYQEKVSGAERNRPQLDYILNHIYKDDVLVVTKLDRLARSTKDLLDIVSILDNKKASLKILNINLDTKSPTGRLMLTMLGAIAEFEREIMLERQKEGIKQAQAEGKYKGRQPFGEEIQSRVLGLRAGGATVANTALECNISRDTVLRICKREKLKGI